MALCNYSNKLQENWNQKIPLLTALSALTAPTNDACILKTPACEQKYFGFPYSIISDIY